MGPEGARLQGTAARREVAVEVAESGGCWRGSGGVSVSVGADDRRRENLGLGLAFLGEVEKDSLERFGVMNSHCCDQFPPVQ